MKDWARSQLGKILGDDASTTAILATAVAGLVGFLILFAATWIWKWRKQIHRRVEEVKQKTGEVMVMSRQRRKPHVPGSRSRLASELDISERYRDWLRQNHPNVEVMSLGEYLDSLQPGGATQLLPREELDLLLSAALIRVLGPKLGGTLLPALTFIPPNFFAMIEQFLLQLMGESKVEEDGIVGSAAGSVPSGVISAMGGVSLMSLLGVGEVAVSLTHRGEVADATSGEEKSAKDEDKSAQDEESPSAIQKVLRCGELESPSFDNLPNPFILSKHWKEALQGLETKIKQAHGGVYEPDKYPEVGTVSVHEVLLPDLYMGLGGAVRTHTNRQILQNRLFSVLINRLAANLLLDEVPDLNEFTVQLAPETGVVSTPDVLIEELVGSGHKVRARTSCRATTFGFGLSVKEQLSESQVEGDYKWVYIPLGMPLRSGLQTSDGTQISSFLMHSCTDFYISGPLFLSDIAVESYHNQEGFAGWVSSHYVDLPFMFDSVSHDVDPVRAMRVTSLLFACINSTATRMNLPNGGYGIVGVCNDSTAIVDQVLRGTTHVYPLSHIGGSFYHVVRRCQELITRLNTMKTLPRGTVADAKALHNTMMHDLPNDVHPIPSTFQSTIRRIQNSMPKEPPFVTMEETIRRLEEEFEAHA